MAQIIKLFDHIIKRPFRSSSLPENHSASVFTFPKTTRAPFALDEDFRREHKDDLVSFDGDNVPTVFGELNDLHTFFTPDPILEADDTLK